MLVGLIHKNTALRHSGSFIIMETIEEEIERYKREGTWWYCNPNEEGVS